MTRLSDQQRAILKAFDMKPVGRAVTIEIDFHRALWGHRRNQGGEALTNSQRASLSRSLRRLEAAGLIEHPAGRRRVWLRTADGDAAVSASEPLSTIVNRSVAA